MQTLLEFWTASPFFATVVFIGFVIAIGIVTGLVTALVFDVIQMLINGVVRLFRGHPPVAGGDEADDDALAEKIADAVRDRVNTVGLLASDVDLIAATTASAVMETADARRAERERARAEQAEAVRVAEEREYQMGDLIEVQVRDDEWVPGWYAGYHKSTEMDVRHHAVSYSEVDSSGHITIESCYLADDDIRHRRPAKVTST